MLPKVIIAAATPRELLGLSMLIWLFPAWAALSIQAQAQPFGETRRSPMVATTISTSLNKQAISGLYLDGDFDQVEERLAGWLRSSSRGGSREDSIFAYKYLGVVCAASPESKAKAENYFYQLLTLSPHIELVDLFVSNQVETIFQNVKRDYHKREQYFKQYDSFGNPIAASDSTPMRRDSSKPSGSPSHESKDKRLTDSKKGSSAWIWWTLGGVGVATGVALYVIASDPGDEKSSTVDLGN